MRFGGSIVKKLLSGILLFALLWTFVTTINKENSLNTSAENLNKMEEAPQVNFKRPSFTLKALDGKKYSTSDVSKPLVINFWASWCGPCKIEAPELVKLNERYGEKVQIYAVNITSGDSIDGARSFAETYGFKFPVLLDVDDAVSKKYHIQAIPTTFFINKDGIIVDQIMGFAGEKIFEEKFQRLVENEVN